MNLLPPRTLLACCLLSAACALSVRAADPTPAPAATAKPDTAPSAPANKPDAPGLDLAATAETTPPAAPAPASTPDPAIAKEVAGLKTADSLWDYIKKWGNLDDIQPDASLPQEAQIAQARAAVAGKISHLQFALPAFIKDYPKDPHVWDAKLMRLFFLRDPESITEKEVTTGLHEIAEAKEAPSEARQQARGVLLENSLQELDPTAGLTDAIDKELTAYEKDFPDDNNGGRLVTLRLRLLGPDAPERAMPLLKTLSQSPNRFTAAAAKSQIAIRTEPLTIKLKATDGQEIDFSKLRGKVVLLDFWATWCVPCMMQIPDLLTAEKKYADQGFQIVGISLDDDKEALAKVVRQKGMKWPQVNDPKGVDGEIPGEFGVGAIPAKWLVDRQGHAHQLPFDAKLDEEIAKVIAEK